MYNDQFFDAMKGNLPSARRVLQLLHSAGHIERPREQPRVPWRIIGSEPSHYDSSALDVGCGIGCWALAASELGFDAHGIDGDYVPRHRLLFPQDKFRMANLEHPMNIGRRYSLVMCMEVAEHLSPGRAESFVKELCDATIGVLLFSAAIPGQGGERHVNERWQSYWRDLISKHLTPGTLLDLSSSGHSYTDVRPLFWQDPNVAWWYQQNIMVFHRSYKSGVPPVPAVDLVHPILYSMRTGVGGG